MFSELAHITKTYRDLHPQMCNQFFHLLVQVDVCAKFLEILLRCSSDVALVRLLAKNMVLFTSQSIVTCWVLYAVEWNIFQWCSGSQS